MRFITSNREPPLDRVPRWSAPLSWSCERGSYKVKAHTRMEVESDSHQVPVMGC